MRVTSTVKAAALAGFVGAAGVAMAEEPVVLASVSPGVLVNQGDMYLPAEAGMVLNQGDQVMVLESSEAQIQYADGCQQQLGENQVVQIADVSTCPQVATAGSTAGLGLATAPAAGSVTGAAMGATFGAAAGSSAFVGAAATAAAVVGVVAIGEAASDDPKDVPRPPASP